TDAHSGAQYFQFSSYYNSDDYHQYLISPLLSLEGDARMSYYSIDVDNEGEEMFQIMVSTTDSELSSFTAIGEVVSPTADWQQRSVVIPNNTRYVAFAYLSEYAYRTGIDDIEIRVFSPTPEIELSSIAAPDYVDTGAVFTVEGTVVNLSNEALTSYTVTYNLGGVTTTRTVSGISVGTGMSHSFGHEIVATGAWRTRLDVAVSNPNGEADDVANNQLYDTVSVCSPIRVLPYSEGFENGMGCWQAVSATTANSAYMGITHQYCHSGTSSFRFSSFYSTTDYSQFLISPLIAADTIIGLTFYAKDLRDYGNERIQLMVSYSDADTSSFSPYGGVIALNGWWKRYDTVLPTGIRYMAIKYVSNYGDFAGIDDIELSPLSASPSVTLTQASVPYMVGTGVPFTVSGTVVNHSATPLTSLDVAYTIDGITTNAHISDIEVAYMHSYQFDVPQTAVIENEGTYQVTLTISNPNGVSDDMSDNQQTAEVQVFLVNNAAPRKVLLEHFSTANCPNCIDGHRSIETGIEGYEDDVVWVTHHAGYYTDRLTVDASSTLTAFYNNNGGTYAPAMMLDRTWFGDFDFAQALGVPHGPVFFPGSGVAEGFATALSVPAYVTVEFQNLSYDTATRQLSVTVGGDVLRDFDAQSPRLNVWLLEDGLIADGGSAPGHGPAQAYADENFTHDHVLREVLNSNTWGEENVIAAECSSYNKTYSMTVSENYIASQCYLIAFVSEGNHSDLNNCPVYNSAKSEKLTDASPEPGPGPGPDPEPNGIDNTFMQTNNDAITIYPNPAAEKLHVSWASEMPTTCSYNIFNMFGHEVLTGTVENDAIDIHVLVAGTYVLLLQTPEHSYRLKFVKK
ncbi:MAG: choice-of-anchor J domain-containing protein, partial [Bacteroidales bacterium]|nr:choice-of-anchor J domain-containing protein [Bacteroidales bacterium]